MKKILFTMENYYSKMSRIPIVVKYFVETITEYINYVNTFHYIVYLNAFSKCIFKTSCRKFIILETSFSSRNNEKTSKRGM